MKLATSGVLSCIWPAMLACAAPRAVDSPRGAEPQGAERVGSQASLLPLQGVKPCPPSVRTRLIAKRPRNPIPGHVYEDAVEIDCNLLLEPGDVVNKRLVLSGEQASGVTIDCNGAMIDGRRWRLSRSEFAIEVRSALDSSGAWRGAENITVRNCTVLGTVRIFGPQLDSDQLRLASYRTDHTQQFQAMASKNITFDNMTITTVAGQNPFYVIYGATRVTLMNSRVRGSAGVSIYLDAETAENVIANNEIDGPIRIQIDGSARNLIVGNSFLGMKRGGIFVYRNCGESGIIRQQHPEDNVIINNVFIDARARANDSTAKARLAKTPAVWIAQRQNDLPGYCDDDAKYPEAPKLGSNLDHRDHAQRTVVAYNRFITPAPQEMIHVDDDPSYVFENAFVDSGDKRKSPCFVARGYPSPILQHGESVALFDDGTGPRCRGSKLTCNDGIAVASIHHCRDEAPELAQFQCRSEGDDKGCSGRATCPGGTSLVALKAACNLEFGEATDTELDRTPWSFGGVVRRSDNLSDGECRIGRSNIDHRGAQLPADSTGGMIFGCKEHDGNGGDCQMRVALACERPVAPAPVDTLDFECQATGNNSGCQQTVRVPGGKKIIGAKAACNLEFGTVSERDLEGVSTNLVQVLRASDDVSDGSCTVGTTSIRSGQAGVSSSIIGQSSLSFGCREHDANGGDCHIKGKIYHR